MKSTSIVFFSSRCAPFRGGVETHVDKVTKELIAMRSCFVTIISSAPSEVEGKNYAEQVGYDFVQIPNSIMTKTKIIMGLNPKILIPALRANIVHFHDWSTVVGIGFFTFLARKVLRKKVFITFHGWEGIFPPDKLVKRVRKIIARLVSGSINVGEYIEKWYATPADLTIIGGVENIRNSEKICTDSQPKEVFFIGRLASDTGAREVLLAWKDIVKSHLNEGASLVVFGDGPLKCSLEKLVNDCDQLRLWTTFRGFVEDPMRMLPTGSIVFTSGYLGILEAFARGGKVIAFYDHALKKDYLESIKNSETLMWCAGSVDELVEYFCQAKSNIDKSKRAIEFVRYLGWGEVKNKYLHLWGLSDKIQRLA